MISTLFCAAALAAAPAPEPVKSADEAPPAKKELFAKEDWYKNEKGKEEDFTGMLKYTPPAKMRIGFGRNNPFRLEFVGKNGFREVYVGGKDDLLKAYASKKVKITGKAVDMEVEGNFHKEIWPARIELLPDEKPKPSPKDLPANPAKDIDEKPSTGDAKAPTIIARGPARIGVKGGEATQLVIRSAEDLAKATGMDDAAKATEAAAQQLKVKDIDFVKQMLIVVSAGTKRSGGYRVEVTGLVVKDKELIVTWKLHTPDPGKPVTLALTHPAETIIVDKFEGKVTFDPAPPKADIKLPPIKRPIDGIKPPRIAPGTLPVVPEKEDPNKPIKICSAVAHLALALQLFLEEPAKATAKEIKVIARGPAPLPAAPGAAAVQQVVCSPKELAAALKQKDEEKAVDTMKRLFKVDAIDFDKQMIVIASGGAQSSGGYKFEITSVALTDGVLTVKWKMEAPKGFATNAFTHPGQAVLIEKSDAKVKFEAGK